MYSNVCLVFSSSLAFLVLFLVEVRAQAGEINLGKLHWCNTLCLCHDDTMEEMHCFQDLEIYSLLEVETRKVQRLSRAGFKLEEKLMWCTETCLCHKAGKKEFKCTNKVRLGEFINERAPFLSPYLEREVEIFDARDIVEKEDEAIPAEGEAEAEEAERKDRHERRKNRKHRKNRKKAHRDRKEEEETEQMTAEVTTTPSAVEIITPESEDGRKVHSAGIFSGGSSGDTPSTRSTEGDSHTPVLEVPRERKTVAGEVATELEELRDNVDHIKEDVSFNQHILLVTVVVAAIAMIGVLILAIYLCCIRKSSKKLPNSPKNSSLRQETNNVTKVNLDEAW